jgi:chromosome segregation ATPase
VKHFGLILAFLFCVGAIAGVVVYYKNQITGMSKALETERYSRLVAEEKAINSVSKIKQLQGELEENEKKIAKVQDLLKEQKNLNKDLDNQFQKLAKAKSQLEQEIQTLISQQAVAAQATAAVEEIVKQDQVVQSNEAAAPAQ